MQTLFQMDGPDVAKKVASDSVKIRADVLRKARAVVAIRGGKLQDYLSDKLAPSVDVDFREAIQEAVDESKPPTKPKR